MAEMDIGGVYEDRVPPKFETRKSPDTVTGMFDPIAAMTRAREMPIPVSPEQQSLTDKYKEIIGKQKEVDEAKRREQQSEAEAVSVYSKDVASKLEARNQAFRNEPLPTFAPTQENAQNLAGLFGLLGVVGAMAGKGGGQQSATNAMNAMTGMMRGWQQGRADLYQQEKDKFEKNFQIVKAKHERLEKEFSAAMEKAKFDLQGATADAKLAAIKEGSDVLAKSIELNGLIKTAEILQQNVEDRKKMEGILLQFGLQEEQRRRAREDREQLMREREEIRAGQTRGASQQIFMAQRAVNSLGGVASALESLTELPAGTTTGILPNLQTKDGMINAIRNQLGRKITKPEAEFMNTLFTGVGRNLASIEASGAATGLATLAQQMQSGVYINAGVDDPYKVAIKLADIKRIAAENIRPAIEAGILPKQQTETAQKLVERIEKAVPYTTTDVIKAYNSALAAKGKGRPTIGAETERVAQPIPTFNTEEEAEAANLPSGTSIIVGGRRATVQ